MALVQFGLLILLLLVTILVFGAPVSFSLGFIGIVGVFLLLDPGHFLQMGNIVFSEATNINQVIVPLFILMAEFLAIGGIASDIYLVLSKYVKRIKGGLGIAAVLACTVFAALCGSSPATAAAVGRISIKEMVKRNWDEGFAIGLVAAAGTIGIMIPPSITLAVFGIITETSISKLFMAGMLPGLLTSASLIAFLLIRAALNPKLVGYGVETDDPSLSEGQSAAAVDYKALKQAMWQDFKLVLPPLILIVVIIGALYIGIATPIEMAAIGSMGALVIIILDKKFNIKILNDVFQNTARSGAMVLFLVFGGFFLSYVVSFLGLPQELARLLTTYVDNKWVIMIGIYIVWFLLGMVIDPTSMIILTIPFLLTTLEAYGFDPIWIGVVSTLCVEIAMITPPVGMNLFILNAVTDAEMKTIIKGSLPFVGVLIFVLTILTIFPQIALFLPSRM